MSPLLQGEGWVGMGFPHGRGEDQEPTEFGGVGPTPPTALAARPGDPAARPRTPPAARRGSGRCSGGRWRTPGTSPRPSRSSAPRSEEHTSELQSLMRISYAGLRLKKK